MKIKIRKALNILIIILVVIGSIIMMNSTASATGLTDTGLSNFKYYTVLSNVFAGLVALAQVICDFTNHKILRISKLSATTAVTMTFLVVAAFFGPLYGWVQFYQGSNLFFHLIVPLVCMVEFILLEEAQTITIRHCILASVSTLAYGTFYLVNVLINGIGQWPDTNDWYAFLSWGYPIGICIFAGIVVVSFGISCLLRLIVRRMNRYNL